MKRGYLYLIILIAVIFFAWLIFFNTTECDSAICFEEKLQKCDRASIRLERDNGVTKYEVRGSKGGECIVSVKLEEVYGLSRENVELFTGKSMMCRIDKGKLADIRIEDVGNDLPKCSGPLKEAIYEVMVTKLYKLVTNDLSSVLEEVENVV